MKGLRVKIEQLASFSPEDAGAIRNLVTKLGSTFQPLTDTELKKLISSPTTSLFVARVSGKKQIVGMATLAVYRIPYLKKAYLDDFIILDNYQGHGIGSKLMQAVLVKASKESAVYIEFTSNPKRVGANKFYQKMGFEKRNTNTYRQNIEYEKS